MNLITCISLNHCIGKEGKLAIRIPEDLARFKRLTTGNIVVMGANTFFGDLRGKGLLNRINIVLTKRAYTLSKSLPFSITTHLVSSLSDLRVVLSNINCDKSKEVFCMGGAAVYQALLPQVNTMYVTHTNSIIREGDTYFNVDWSKWEIEEIEFTDRCTFAKYVKK